MYRKLIIVTGANRGIGKGIVEGLAEKGHQVVMVCRNTKRGEERRYEFTRSNPNPRRHHHGWKRAMGA